MDMKSLSAIAPACLWFTLLSNSGHAVTGDHTARKPNIVLIMADDLGYRELGCYGQSKIRTPHIDRLAAQGMRFTNYYSGSAVCAPARCNLITGRHGGQAYIRDNGEVGGWDTFQGQTPLPAGTVTIASLLKQAGYATGVFGKWGLGGVNTSGDPLNQGFDRFFGYNCQRHAHNLYPRYLIDDKTKKVLQGNTRDVTGRHYAPQVIADEMLKFVRANQDQPFFLYYATVLPHLALQAPQDAIDEYKGQWEETPYTGKSYQPHPTPKSCYAAMISFLDKQIGRLMHLLDELGLDQETIVFFTSDNGTTFLKKQVDYEFFNSVGNLRGLKGSLYEGGIRVPLIVRWPGRIKADTTTEHIGAHYDIMATLCELVECKTRPDSNGISFLSTLLSQPSQQKQHKHLFWDFSGYGGQLAVRMGRWKGIKRDLKKNPQAALELYDLINDEGETTDLASARPDIAEKIETIMMTDRTEPEVKKFRFGQYGR